jgi:hypothetical protein
VRLPSLKEVPVLLTIGFTLVWLFWGEFRTKMIKVTIDANNISVRKFGGLGRERDFPLSDFDEISEAYHKNYKELKSEIQTKMNDLGYENFKFTDEIKEIFL